MKELEEIYQEMLDCFAQRTGLEAAESCDLAVRFYAVAAQVYALYAQADWVLRQCFPQTAAGSCLDSHAQLRGLSRKQATAAEGSIRFSVARAADTDRPIPAGTVCMTPGLIRFETAQAAVLEAGASWVDVPARALTPGSAGNVPAGAVVDDITLIAGSRGELAVGGGSNAVGLVKGPGHAVDVDVPAEEQGKEGGLHQFSAPRKEISYQAPSPTVSGVRLAW